jgi:small-conductance mechanosensitive channel
MAAFFNEYRTYVIPALVIIGAFLSGLLIERLVLYIIKKITKNIKWENDNLIVKALKGEIVVTFVMIGIYSTGFILDLPIQLKELSEKALVVILILMASIFFARVISGFIKSYFLRHATIIFAATLITNILKILILSMGALIILSYLNISVIPIITTLGVGGIAIALALQPTLSNLFSGFQLLLSKQLKPGDYIRLASGEEGYVEDISWRHTVIRTLPGNLVTIPNSRLADSIITNFYMPQKDLSVLIDLGVGYDSDLSRVEKITIEAGKKVMNGIAGGVPGFEPLIRFHTFGDYSIQFTVVLRAQTYVDQYLIKHEFLKLLHAMYKEDKIEIPYPIRTIITKKEG